MQLTCPSEDRLREFLSGAVSDAEVSQISDHVDGCSNCDLTISKIENQQEDVLEELREGLRIERLLNEPELQQLCDTVEFPSANAITLSDQDQPVGSGKRLRDYRLVKKIGEGGMGTVYHAVHVHLGKSVALKILPADKLRSRSAVDRFRQEMRAVGKVNHPNVVSASDAGTADGQHFLVMELVEGADLARIIQDQGTLQIANACEIVRQAATGLQHAHKSGLVHRDVKPSNLMLAIDGSVKVLDLGLAGLSTTDFESTTSVVVTDRLTSVGQIMGTLDYMAPEQIASSLHVDGRADIYALGATLFQLLTKRTPCGDRSADTPERIEAVLHEPPLDVASLREDVPQDLAVLLQKMLEKTPQNRPQTAEDVANQLSQFTAEADLVALADKCRTSLDIPSADVDVTDDVSFLVTRTETKAEAEHPPQTHVVLQKSAKPRWPIAAVALATLLVVAIFAGTVFYIQTDNGKVCVTVKNDSLAVKFSDVEIRDDDGNREFTISAGEQKKLIVSQDGSDLQFETDSFVIRRNDQIDFEVRLLKGSVVITRDGKQFHRETVPAKSEIALQKEAENAVARGEIAIARKILRTIPNIGTYENSSYGRPIASDSDAAVSFKFAELLERTGNFTQAANAYLEAYRLEPRMLNDDHLPTIKTAGLTSQYAEVFTEANMQMLPDHSYCAINIMQDLLKDEATRSDGNRFLKRVWSKTEYHYSLLKSFPEEIWPYVPDPEYYLRSKLIPSDIAFQGAGWGHFEVSVTSDSTSSAEPAWGFPLALRPLLSNKAVLRNLANEAETAITQNPDWKAGPAVLAYLEAHIGNYHRATELLGQVLEEAETRPVPSDSAWLFGMSLEGMNAELDRQVMRLYESSLRNRPDRVFRASAIPKLGQLYAKYGEPLVARQVLHRLTDVDYNPTGASGVYCSPAYHSRNRARCTACHSGKSNLLDIVVMSNNLTDVGFPVDAMISLARIDASFSNAYGSDDTWAKKVFPQDGALNIKRGRSRFTPAKTKAEMAITPQAVLKALQSGVFSGRDMTKPVAVNFDNTIDLMLSVRGEAGKPSVFSPVIDVLKLAAEWDKNEDSAAVETIDGRLHRLSEANPKDVPTLVAATAFAFLRNDLPAAERRARQLQQLSAPTDGNTIQADVSLWIVARHALKHKQTRIIGAILAERALAAADTHPNSRIKEAIISDQSTIRTK